MEYIVKKVIRAHIEKNLVIEDFKEKSRAEIELEAEELLLKAIKTKSESELYDFDERYDSNLTSIYYVLASVEEYLDEIKTIFKEIAEKRAWVEHGIKMFDRHEASAEIYDMLKYSKHHSIQKERQLILLEIYELLDDEVFEIWQDEIYEEWR